MEEKEPKRAKGLGDSQVEWKGTKQQWYDFAREKMTTANWAKFEQNSELRDKLLETNGSLLALASTNKVWGTGFGLEDKRNSNPENWTGLNLMGYMLTQIRIDIMASSTSTSSSTLEAQSTDSREKRKLDERTSPPTNSKLSSAKISRTESESSLPNAEIEWVPVERSYRGRRY